MISQKTKFKKEQEITQIEKFISKHADIMSIIIKKSLTKSLNETD